VSGKKGKNGEAKRGIAEKPREKGNHCCESKGQKIPLTTSLSKRREEDAIPVGDEKTTGTMVHEVREGGRGGGAQSLTFTRQKTGRQSRRKRNWRASSKEKGGEKGTFGHR